MDQQQISSKGCDQQESESPRNFAVTANFYSPTISQLAPVWQSRIADALADDLEIRKNRLPWTQSIRKTVFPGQRGGDSICGDDSHRPAHQVGLFLHTGENRTFVS